MNRIPSQPDRRQKAVAGCQLSVARNAFTLIEVMISIAIALVLILGVSQIFSMAQQTTGAGTQVLIATDVNRGIQEQLLYDSRGITNAVGDSPALVIASYTQAVWRNKQDQLQDNDGDPTTLNDPVNAGKSLPRQSAAAVNDRIHRTDIFGFFARGQFTRRTGDGGNPVDPNYPPSLTSATTSGEAFIWYGHLALPDNSEITQWNYLNPGMRVASPPGQYRNPGEGTPTLNPNNFFASDWILGRQVMLLSPRAPGSAIYNEPHIKGTSEGFDPLRLLQTSPAVANDTNNVALSASRYDLADTSIAVYRSFLPALGVKWWQGMVGFDPSVSPSGQQTRYDANPFARKPLTKGAGTETQQLSAAMAQMSPIFVRGCTQFVVEFAGDYVTQNINGVIGTTDANGKTTTGGSDGQIDYYVDNNGARQIRWYGFPRDSAGDGGPTFSDGGVLPVGMVFKAAGVTPPAGWLNSDGSGNLAFEQVAASSGYTLPATPNPSNNGLPAFGAPPYICAWGPTTDAVGIPRPKMIRITIGIDDPSGHLNTQQVFEYVFNLP